MLSIRPGTIEDAQAIAELGRELNVHQRDPVENFTVEVVRQDGFGESPAFEVLLAELDGAPVGYALFYGAYETGFGIAGLYLCDLYVREEARRHGVGRALVAAVASAAKDRDKNFVWWASKEWNTEAQAFYRALGAVEEPVVAHAVFGQAFDKLAAEGSERQSEPSAERTRTPRDP
ncbi:MAG: GNAT family N-acetyltransferase [Alphaproteobacteria bacterium]|nr:GNAT family N-acetyltransferase [Alphaproteobacteria bacterium]